jgi:zinc transporter ZupT
VRGVLAPVTAFALAREVSLGVLAGIASTMIVVATLMLLPEIKHGKTSRRTSALVEEVTD